MRKQVWIVSASLRPNSNSDALARAFAKGARDAGHTVTEVSLRGKDLRFCQGGLACQRTGRCHIPDDAAALVRQMHDADVLVFATPIYY